MKSGELLRGFVKSSVNETMDYTFCLSREDSEEDKGFDVKKTSTAMESCDAVYRCLK